MKTNNITEIEEAIENGSYTEETYDNGIYNIIDHSSGIRYSCHPSIDITG